MPIGDSGFKRPLHMLLSIIGVTDTNFFSTAPRGLRTLRVVCADLLVTAVDEVDKLLLGTNETRDVIRRYLCMCLTRRVTAGQIARQSVYNEQAAVVDFSLVRVTGSFAGYAHSAIAGFQRDEHEKKRVPTGKLALIACKLSSPDLKALLGLPSLSEELDIFSELSEVLTFWRRGAQWRFNVQASRQYHSGACPEVSFYFIRHQYHHLCGARTVSV
ncbi:hypothetical protein C8Q74DRAFT_1220411 [Fomes fomentarius]|nr:hypothetical protein C8Q74DRAFT_1220411 [Fomes fomentarius]